MARTLTATEERVYAAGEMSVHLEVSIKDAGGNWIELTNLEGRNWVDKLTHSKDIDEPVESCVIELDQSFYDLKLSPFVAASKINNPSGGLEERIGIGRAVVVRVAVMPLGGGEPASSDWRLLFHGDVVAMDAAAVRLQCVDLGGRLQRLKLERAGQPEGGSGGTYNGGNPYVGPGAAMFPSPADAEDVMQAILDDWAPALGITLVTPVSPAWGLTEKWSESNPAQDANVLDTLRSIASQIGWDVRYRFDASATDPFGVTAAGGGCGNFTLQFYEPDRSNTTPDFTVGPDDYHSVSSFVQDIATIGNKVEVMYVDPDGVGNAQLQTVIAEDAGSQADYGVLYVSVSEEKTVGIENDTDAQRLADAILHDVLDPRAEMHCGAIFLYHAELFDLARFTANGEVWDSNQDLAIANVTHTFGGGDATTTLLLRGSIAGHRPHWWLSAFDDAVNTAGDPDVYGTGHTINRNDSGHVKFQPPDLSVDVTLNGFKLKVTDLPPDVSHVEWHLDPTGNAAFTPDATTLAAVTKTSAYPISDLEQGTTYAAKAIFVTRGGVKSPASTAITSAPGEALDRLSLDNFLELNDADATPVADRRLRVIDGEIRATDTLNAEGQYIRGASLKEGTGPLTKLSSSGFLDNVTSITVRGALASADYVGARTIADGVLRMYTVSPADVFTFTAAADPAPAEIEWATFEVDVVMPDGTATAADLAASGAASSARYGWVDLDVSTTVIQTGATPPTNPDPSKVLLLWAMAGDPYDAADVVYLPKHSGEVVVDRARIGGLVVGASGTSFPSNPGTNDQFFRTDRGVLYYYDGTRWLSVTEYTTDMSTYGQLWNSITVNSQTFAISSVPDLGGTQVYLTKWRIRTQVGGTNDGTNYWTVSLKNDAGSTIASFNTSADGSSGTDHHQTINSVRTIATDKYWFAQPSKTLSPGTLTAIGCSLQFRLIG